MNKISRTGTFDRKNISGTVMKFLSHEQISLVRKNLIGTKSQTNEQNFFVWNKVLGKDANFF